MVTTDTVADMLTRIRNAFLIKEDLVDIPWSKFKQQIAHVLEREGFVGKVEVITRGSIKILRVFLKYRKNKKPSIVVIKSVSTPGCRVYVKSAKIPYVLSGFGIAVLSTPKGVMSDGEARAQKVGGELLCYIW
ncbi:MAG: 30S ribosomal protein S8 [Candidatus Saganbacteria bacterium]|nr:30S ribosomal protein S8 [Candidatus Saganbacteria bacterium]